LNEKPNRTWPEAVNRWIEEASYKRSIEDDKLHLRWLDPYLGHLSLKQITRDVIDDLVKKRKYDRRNKSKKDAKNKPKPLSTATINRMLEIIRAILRKAVHEWEWLDKAPNIRIARG
jgi:hypothetical protein